MLGLFLASKINLFLSFLKFQFAIHSGAFWKGFGRVWGGFGKGFGKVWGGFWEGLERVWERFGRDFCLEFGFEHHIWELGCSNCVWTICFEF